VRVVTKKWFYPVINIIWNIEAGIFFKDWSMAYTVEGLGKVKGQYDNSLSCWSFSCEKQFEKQVQCMLFCQNKWCIPSKELKRTKAKKNLKRARVWFQPRPWMTDLLSSRLNYWWIESCKLNGSVTECRSAECRMVKMMYYRPNAERRWTLCRTAQCQTGRMPKTKFDFSVCCA